MQKAVFASVIPRIRLPREFHYFDYAIPEVFIPFVQSGIIVTIPFRKKNVLGLVEYVSSQTSFKKPLKEIQAVPDRTLILPKIFFSLLHFLSDEFALSAPTSLHSMLPALSLKSLNKNVSKHFIGGESITIKKSRLKFLTEQKSRLLNPCQKDILLLYSCDIEKMFVASMKIHHVLSQKKQVLILVPLESSLRQWISFLQSRFSQTRFCLFSSSQSRVDHSMSWNQFRTGRCQVLIGTKSAIFVPFVNLGLCIIDDEDQIGHKQFDQNPRYDTGVISAFLSKQKNVDRIFTSRWPKTSTWFRIPSSGHLDIRSKKSHGPLPFISHSFQGNQKPDTLFSPKIHHIVMETIQNRFSTLMIIDRAGKFKKIHCQDCEKNLVCPSCHLPLFKEWSNQFICDHCQTPLRLSKCPYCKSSSLRATGFGLRNLKSMIERSFKNQEVIPIDKKYSDQNKVSILLGNRSSVHSLNWKKIGCVLFLFPELMLHEGSVHGNDGLMSFVAFLTSRISSNDQSLLILITSMPSYPAFVFAGSQNISKYYSKELEERKAFLSPPFSRLIRLIFSGPSGTINYSNACDVEKKIQQTLFHDILSVSHPYQRTTDNEKSHQWNILIKIKPLKSLSLRNFLPSDCMVDCDPASIY